MIEDYTIEFQLALIASQKVKHGEYPVPRPLISDSEQRKQLSDLKAERVQRPPTKQQYFSLLSTLQKEIEGITSENKQILIDNEAARKAVDDKYNSDIEKAKLDEANIGQALCNCINHQLNQTTWYVVKDSQLTVSKQAEADGWRDAVMRIPTDYPKINDAVARYESLTATKPDIDIKWTLEAKP
jgi:phenylalanyl-tRNA synthetase alpha subunit